MALPMYQKYSATKHFQLRAKDRFGIEPELFKDWTKSILKNAQQNRSTTVGRKVYRTGEIEFVVDVIAFKLITIYPLGTQDGIDDEIKLNPEIATALNETMSNLKNRIIRRTSKQVAKYAKDNAELYEKIGNSRNNKYINEWYGKISDNNIDIAREVNKQNELIDQIEMKLA